jgi:hypothetical protein
MLTALLFGVIVITPIHAAEIAEVELIDGSVISGEISTDKDGFYIFTSDTLGTVKIEKSKIRAIRFNPSSAPHANKQNTISASPQAQVQTLQQLIMGDPEILKMLLSLLNDPDIQRILEDPSIIEAISRGDIEMLSSNPDFLKLMNNPVIQDITGKIAD